MFDSLSIKLEKAIQKLKGQSRITELNVAGTAKEIRTALMEADVHYKIAKEVTDEIKKEAMGKDVIASVSPGQLLVKITNDKLTQLMGGQNERIRLDGNPAVALIVGLQGSGKTTFAGKLAHSLKRQGKQTMLAACDVYRPAAIEQLKTLGKQVGIDVYAEEDNKKPVKIAAAALEKAKAENVKVLIVDTAGRLAIDKPMMDEVAQLKKCLSPSETLFVADAMTGQDAVNTAKAFNDTLDFDGIALTKMDGDARGGAALSIRKITGKPIKFIGTGEKIDDLDLFFPDRMAGRILGMGDVVGLVEKAQQTFDQEEAKRINKKFRKNKFDLNDFLYQLQQIQKMGGVKELANMLPKAGQQPATRDMDDGMIKATEAIIRSMTKEERTYPEKLNNSRKNRIAKGSGNSVQQVNQLLKQFEGMRKMMKRVNRMGGMKSALSAMNMFK